MYFMFIRVVQRHRGSAHVRRIGAFTLLKPRSVLSRRVPLASVASIYAANAAAKVSSDPSE